MLHEAQVGLDPGGVAVHEEADGAGGRQHGGLAVANADPLCERTGLEPGRAAGGHQGGRHLGVQELCRITVHLQHAEHGLAVVLEAVERPHAVRQPGRGPVGVPGHHRRDGSGHRPTIVAVVGEAQGHEERTQVGVAQPQLSKGPGGLADGLRRIVGVADQDLLGGEDDLDRMAEAVDVEAPDRIAVVVGVTQELQQVDARQIARAVIQVDVLRAVRDQQPVHDVGVVAGLGEVVGQLVTVIDPRYEAGRRGRPVSDALPISQQAVEQPLLATQVEADVGSERLDGTAGDTEVPGCLRPVGDHRAVRARVLQTAHATTARCMDPTGDAEGLQQPLHTHQQAPGDGRQPDVRPVVIAPVDAAVGVEEAPEERCGDLGWRLEDRPGHDLVGACHRQHPERLQIPLEPAPGEPQLDGSIGLFGGLQRAVVVDPFEQGVVSDHDLVAVLGRAVDGGRRRPGRGAVTDQPPEVVPEQGAPLVGQTEVSGMVAAGPVVLGIRRDRDRRVGLFGERGQVQQADIVLLRELVGLHPATVGGEQPMVRRAPDLVPRVELEP